MMRLGNCNISNSFRINIPGEYNPPPSPGDWDNLLHWYSFDETEGDLLDLTGSDDGTLTGCTQGETGKVETSYGFNGSGELITLNTGEAFGTGDFSITLWAKPNAEAGVLVAGATDAFTLIFGWTTLRLRALQEGGSGTDVADLHMTEDEWNFVSIVRDGTNIRLGVNGSFEDETLDVDFTGVMNTIGEGQEAIDYSGSIDELNIWDVALTDAQITTLYNGGDGSVYTSASIF